MKEIEGERFYLGIFPVDFLCFDSCSLCEEDPEYYASWIFKGDILTAPVCKDHSKLIHEKESSSSKTDARYEKEAHKNVIRIKK